MKSSAEYYGTIHELSSRGSGPIRELPVRGITRHEDTGGDGRYTLEMGGRLYARKVAERPHQRADFDPAYSVVPTVLQVRETAQSDSVSSSVLQYLPAKNGRLCNPRGYSLERGVDFIRRLMQAEAFCDEIRTLLKNKSVPEAQQTTVEKSSHICKLLLFISEADLMRKNG